MSLELSQPEEPAESGPSASNVVFPHEPGKLHAHSIVFSRLAFPVAHLFAAGSPIAIFLMMRGASAQRTDPCHGPHLLPPKTR